jgi:hypothetical protein
MDNCDIINIITAIAGMALIISEILPYASSSRCNSILEAFSHLLCKNNCFVSNKQIIFDNTELVKEVSHLKREIKNLTTLRTSLDVERIVGNV